MPAATAAASGGFSHLVRSKERCSGRVVNSTGFEKSVGTAGASSLRLRRSAGAAALLASAEVAGVPPRRSPSMSCGGAALAGGCGCAWPSALGACSLLDFPLLASPEAAVLSPDAEAGDVGAPSAEADSPFFSFSFSACARRMALSFCTRFTVVGIRTPSSSFFRFSLSSPWPSMSQSSAACVSFWWRRRARLAGPSSKPCESNEERESGSTGREGPDSSSGASLAFLSMSLAEKSAMGASAPVAAWTALPPSSLSWSSMSTWASRCSGVISTIGRNSMRLGSILEIACADVAKNSYSRYFSVCRVESRISPRYSSKM
mmetsp:Transcript_118913/g.265432  ORF Transcript_118913/g.265432 Transcript_118913/m.265432 type:complete len:318 (-) Transcript_118913:737-1690(-)